MKINSISGNNFGAFMMMPIQNVPPVAAIVRNVERAQIKPAAFVQPRLKLSSLPKNSNPNSDMFILHEAVVPDTKIRVVGAGKRPSSTSFPQTKLKGKGRQNYDKTYRR